MDFQPSNIRDSRFDEVLEASKRQSVLASNGQTTAALPAPEITFCAGTTKAWRVLIDGQTYDQFNTSTAGIRCRALLVELAGLGRLPSPAGYPARNPQTGDA